MKKQLVFMTKEEIEQIQKILREYNKLKKALCIGEADYDYDTKSYNLVQRVDVANPVIKELGSLARKVDMILSHLGLKYTEEPGLLKMKKCVETDE